MDRKFSELVAKMSPEAQAESEREARRMIAAMKLAQKNQADAEEIAERGQNPRVACGTCRAANENQWGKFQRGEHVTRASRRAASTVVSTHGNSIVLAERD